MVKNVFEKSLLIMLNKSLIKLIRLKRFDLKTAIDVFLFYVTWAYIMGRWPGKTPPSKVNAALNDQTLPTAMALVVLGPHGALLMQLSYPLLKVPTLLISQISGDDV